MELYQLRAFIAVAEHGQLHKASEHLHLTQSALSKQIKNLESELDVLLFERTREGMQLTAVGRPLLALAAQVTRSVEQMSTLVASLSGQVVGTLRVGTVLDPEAIRLGPLMVELLRFYPHVNVTLVPGVSGVLHERLRKGEIDACFHLGLPKDPQVVMQQLCLEHYIVIAPPAWAERVRSATRLERCQAALSAVAAVPPRRRAARRDPGAAGHALHRLGGRAHAGLRAVRLVPRTQRAGSDLP